MTDASTQEAVVTVEAQVERLVPCPAHEGCGTGEQVYDGAGRGLQNPNGYRHDCGECLRTPRVIETIIVEGVTVNER